MKKTKVLLVDDSEGIRITAKILVKKKGFGFDLTTVDSAAAATNLFMKNKYDLIITDYSMPQKNGYEFIEDIKKLGKSIPPIFAYTSDLNPQQVFNNSPLISIYFAKDELIKCFEHIESRFN